MKKTVGMRLKEMRKEHKLTLRELSEKTGLNITSLHNYESDKGHPSLLSIARIADVYGVSIDWFALGCLEDCDGRMHK